MDQIIELLSGILAAFAHHFTLGLANDETLAYGAAGVSSLLFGVFCKALLELVRTNHRFDARFKAVGMWIESIDHGAGRQYTISEITYNKSKQEFEIIGHTFVDESLRVFSVWHSLSVSFTERNGLYYIYSLKNYITEPSDVVGIAHMSFFVTGSGGSRFFDGQGYFLDQTSNSQEVRYNFRRINKELTKELIQKSNLRSAEDRRKFLQEYGARGLAWTPYHSAKTTTVAEPPPP